jgi:hypothetical protein
LTERHITVPIALVEADADRVKKKLSAWFAGSRMLAMIGVVM